MSSTAMKTRPTMITMLRRRFDPSAPIAERTGAQFRHRMPTSVWTMQPTPTGGSHRPQVSEVSTSLWLAQRTLTPHSERVPALLERYPAEGQSYMIGRRTLPTGVRAVAGLVARVSEVAGDGP